jgi:hypothetical protein
VVGTKRRVAEFLPSDKESVMDLITAVLIGGAAKLGEFVLKDGYEKLKSLIFAKVGPDAPIAGTLKELEASPDSVGHQKVLEGQVALAKLSDDAQVVAAATALRDLLKKSPNPPQVLTQIVSGEGHVFSQTGNVTQTGNVNVRR